MNTFKPEIQELLKAVEKKYSQNLRTTTDFDVFSLHLKLQLDVSISTSTLSGCGVMSKTSTNRGIRHLILSHNTSAFSTSTSSALT